MYSEGTLILTYEYYIMDNYLKALEYVQQGRLSRVNKGDLDLFCYTKKEFFDKTNWDDITISHRGKLYQRGLPVNSPFPKIFNVGEIDDVDTDTILQLIDLESSYKHGVPDSYDIFDKANGHLLILSIFKDVITGETQYQFSTKGSLPNPNNDLLNKDIELFSDEALNIMLHHFETQSFNNDRLVAHTCMFEPIVEHDKHSMYDTMIESYGVDTFVLLAMRTLEHHNMVTEIDVDELFDGGLLSEIPNIKCIKKIYSVSSKDECVTSERFYEMKSDTGREGYVLCFNIDSDLLRVKIKTDEYWKLRFKKELTTERILSLYKKGGTDLLQLKLPEEVYDVAVDAIVDVLDTWIIDMAYIGNQPERFAALSIKAEEDYSPDNLSKLIKDNIDWLNHYQIFEIRNIATEVDYKTMFNRKKSYREAFVDIILKEDNHFSYTIDYKIKTSVNEL